MRTIYRFLACLILVAPLGAVDAPRITSVTPASPVVNAEPQTLKIAGTGFVSGFTAELMLLGTTHEFSGEKLGRPTSTSFAITLVLAQPGDATLVVTNPDGGVSKPFPLRVRARR